MLKKRIFIILIFTISTCFFVDMAYAVDKAIIYLSSQQDFVEKGQEIEVSVNIESAKTAAFNFSLYFDQSKFEYISELSNTSVIDHRISVVWFDEKGGEGAKEGKLITFKFRAKEEGLATFLIEGEFYDSNGQLIQTDFMEKQIQIEKVENNILRRSEEAIKEEKNSAYLQTLRLDREGLVPNFDKTVYEYYLTIPDEIQDIEVLAVAESSNAVIEISGNKNLQKGLNDIVIHVASDDGIKDNVYTIHVSKTGNLELTNANLEILAIENELLNPPFDVSQTNYKIEISNEKSSIHILAVPEMENSIVEVMGGNDLKEGNNLIVIMVTAPDGFTKRKYEVEVYRRDLWEENDYQEEQKRRKEDLEKAYQMEETSSVDINKIQEDATKVQSEKYQNFMIFGILIVILVLILFWVIRKRKK